jgi:hypothetical protein
MRLASVPTKSDPYLIAWIEAIRGEPLTEDDYGAGGVAPDAKPL